MLNSRDIDKLRPDVAANCKTFLTMCAREGLQVLITGTVRDAAYQEQCYKNGTAKTKVPSFHSEAAGLAFDICKNVKGGEYSDLAFFDKCAAIGKRIGFEWGGDWKSFPDRPHFQWSGAKNEYTSADIIAKRYPPAMPTYAAQEVQEVRRSIEQVKAYVQEKAGLSDSTMAFLSAYKFGDDLFYKLNTAMGGK